MDLDRSNTLPAASSASANEVENPRSAQPLPAPSLSATTFSQATEAVAQADSSTVHLYAVPNSGEFAKRCLCLLIPFRKTYTFSPFPARLYFLLFLFLAIYLTIFQSLMAIFWTCVRVGVCRTCLNTSVFLH